MELISSTLRPKYRQDASGDGRRFPKICKFDLVALLGSKCTLTGEVLEPRYLQIDHRIPDQVVGEMASEAIDAFMLLDASSQRAKSWSCEQCDNFKRIHDPEICRRCFWAYPESYEHVAMKRERRLHIVWQGQEISTYDELESHALAQNEDIHDLVKRILARHLLNG